MNQNDPARKASAILRQAEMNYNRVRNQLANVFLLQSMAFQTILDRWRRAGRTTDADRADVGLGTFAARHPQVRDNLDNDRQVLQADREALLEQVISVDVNDTKLVEGAVLAYCRSHHRAGRANATAQRAALGHVEERRKTEKTFESTVFAKTPLVRQNRSAVLFVERLLAEDLTQQRSLLNGSLLSGWLMWGFYQPRRLDAAFHGVSKERSELVRRLGLGRADPDEELLLWEHGLEPHQTAHRPTAFDAEAYDYFRPGGKTRPLTGTDGLHEVVHVPVAGSQLAARMEVAS